jgi:hypothetical protein
MTRIATSDPDWEMEPRTSGISSPITFRSMQIASRVALKILPIRLGRGWFSGTAAQHCAAQGLAHRVTNQGGPQGSVEVLPVRAHRAAALVVLAWAVASFSVAANSGGAEPFFRVVAAEPAPARPMFFSIYSVLPLQNGRDNMATVAAGHFTAAGPYYNADGQPVGSGAAFYARVGDAVTHGLQYIAQISKHPALIDNTDGEIRPASMAAISESDLRAHVRTVMNYTLNNSTANAAVPAWFILPEELRPWKPAEMNYLRIIADEVHRHDPLRRPVTMYNPNHRTADELTTIVSTGLHWTVMGVYATEVPLAKRGARIASGVDRILAAAAATSTVPIAAFDLSRDYPAVELQTMRAALGGVSQADAIRHIVRHDVYAGLVRGIEGVQIWSGCDCRPGLTTFQEQLAAYASVSNDLNGNLHFSEILLTGEHRNDLQVTAIAGPASVTFETTTTPSLNWAERALDDARYLLLVNSAAASVTAEITGLPAGDASIASLFDPSRLPAIDPATGRMTLAMRPLEVVALRIDGVVNVDANGDHAISGIDFLAWQRNLGRTRASGPTSGDFNYDGVVDRRDLAAWQAQSAAAGVAVQGSVPEPGPCTTLAVGAFQLALRGRGCRVVKWRPERCR